MGLDPRPVTSGSKGIHLYAGLDGTQSSEEVSDVAHELARALEADNPDLVVSRMKKSERRGKVFVDWSQNNASKTTITPYSLRGRLRPYVAAPRTWQELASPSLAQLDMWEVLDRVKKLGDLLPDPDSVKGRSRTRVPDKISEEAAGAKEDRRLATYRSKRNTDRTPEPFPDQPHAVGRGTLFVIQKHAARRLHYDVRLERDGVLVSWAVPKGIPETRRENHLAVQTEDHPLEYADFAGDIPAGEYGAGHVEIWDTGDYETEKWREDEIIVTLHGTKTAGLGGPARIALIRTGGSDDRDRWLLHRMPSGGKRERAERKPLAPMLATAGTAGDVTPRSEWAIEMKWDGIRVLADLRNESVTLTSRNGKDVTGVYPELGGIGRLIHADDAVLDGEIVTFDAQGRPDFGLLQTRMGLSAKREIQAAMKTAPVTYLVFDILRLDDEDLTGAAYDERRAVLRRVVGSRTGVLRAPGVYRGSLSAALQHSADSGYEGVVAKRRHSTYMPGRRSSDWVKIKHLRSQEVVIVGWKKGHGAREGTIGSLLLAIPEDGTLTYVGKVGTGFRDADLRRLHRRLTKLERKTAPLTGIPRQETAETHWVRPVMVGEVAFTEWSAGGRLRHPSWRGLRPDKEAPEVVRES
jgi:bifunctional non-homologous end joining protein LigD